MLVEAVVPASIYKLVNPKHNIKLKMGEAVVEAVLLKFAYTPLPDGTFAPRRDHPEVLEPAKKINYWQELTITKGRKLWEGRVMPEYAVLVEEIKEGKFRFEKSIILKWPGDIRATSEQIALLPQVGELTGRAKDGVYELVGDAVQQLTDSLNVTQAQDRVHRDTVEVEVKTLETAEDLDEFMSDTDVPSTPVAVETSPEYTGDKFEQDPVTGHFIGDDNFRVPLNFEEFKERYPYYVRNWVKKRLHKNIVDEDVEDWESELNIFLSWLPPQSKHRTPGANGRPAGCTDVVETFNPIMQYGASEKRFRNYINMCLGNRFNTIMSKRNKNPVCRPGNYSLAAQMDPENYEVVDDEYVHANSEHLTHSTNRQRVQFDQSLFLGEFISFVTKEDPTVIPVMHAMAATSTHSEAQRELGMTEQDYNRARSRLKQLGECFQNGTIVPKQRKPYKKRNGGSTPAAAVAVAGE